MLSKAMVIQDLEYRIAAAQMLSRKYADQDNLELATWSEGRAQAYMSFLADIRTCQFDAGPILDTSDER